MLDPLVEPLHQVRCPQLPPVAYRQTGDYQRLRPVHLLPFGQPRGLFLILLPDLVGPLGLGAIPGVENRPDAGRTSVGMN